MGRNGTIIIDPEFKRNAARGGSPVRTKRPRPCVEEELRETAAVIIAGAEEEQLTRSLRHSHLSIMRKGGSASALTVEFFALGLRKKVGGRRGWEHRRRRIP